MLPQLKGLRDTLSGTCTAVARTNGTRCVKRRRGMHGGRPTLDIEWTAVVLWSGEKALRKTPVIAKRVRPGRRVRPPIVEVVESREQLQIWLCDAEGRQLADSIGLALVADAKRLGQDLVSKLVEKALREADRRSITS
jgi:hypothetical protein